MTTPESDPRPDQRLRAAARYQLTGPRRLAGSANRPAYRSVSALGSPEFASFTVTDVDYGDLDGDGREDAAVSVELFTGGTGRFRIT